MPKRILLKKGMPFISLLTICLLLLSGCSKNELSGSDKIGSDTQQEAEKDTVTLPDGSIVYSDGSMKLEEGSVSYGLYDPYGKLVQTGDTLPVLNDLITGTVSFQQNLPGNEIEYSLIVLVDYIQKSFSVDGQSYAAYLFTLQAEDIIDINIELALPENAKTLTFLIIYEPNMMDLTFDTEEGRNNLFNTSMCRTITCYLSDYEYNESDLSFCEDSVTCNANTSGLFLTKDLEEQSVMPSCNSNDIAKAVFGNSTDQDKTYVMLAFLNWEQYPIENEPYKLFRVKARQGYYYDIKMPEVDTASPYQIFFIENPFNPTLRDWNLGTMRTIIIP